MAWTKDEWALFNSTQKPAPGTEGNPVSPSCIETAIIQLWFSPKGRWSQCFKGDHLPMSSVMDQSISSFCHLSDNYGGKNSSNPMIQLFLSYEWPSWKMSFKTEDFIASLCLILQDLKLFHWSCPILFKLWNPTRNESFWKDTQFDRHFTLRPSRRMAGL